MLTTLLAPSTLVFEEGPQAPTEFMPRERYRKHLRHMSPHLISEDQHIFLIIASVHGGADHPDNYLAPLGSSFMSLGEKMDPFICFIAGKEKTLQDVAISMKAEALYQAYSGDWSSSMHTTDELVMNERRATKWKNH